MKTVLNSLENRKMQITFCVMKRNEEEFFRVRLLIKKIPKEQKKVEENERKEYKKTSPAPVET